MVAAVTRISWFGGGAGEPAGVSAMDTTGLVFNREDSRIGTGVTAGVPIPLVPSTLYSWPKLLALEVTSVGTTTITNRRFSLVSAMLPGLHWYVRGLATYAQPAALVDNLVANNTPPTQLAPTIPTLVAAGAGGSWAAQTAWVFVTYVGLGGGETDVSPVASQAVVLNGTLTINSPPTVPGAAGWYAYVGVGASQPANSAMHRQQAVGVPTALGANLLMLASPTATGAIPPVANTAAAFIEATSVTLPVYDAAAVVTSGLGRNGGFCQMVLGADNAYQVAGGQAGIVPMPPYRLMYDET